MLHTFLFITASDILSVEESQNILMQRFTEAVDPQLIQLLCADGPTRDICQWKRLSRGSGKTFDVSCEEGILRSVIIESERHLYRPEFLPQTVQLFTMIDCSQKYPFSMRHLPSAARSVNIHQNQLYGRLDLTCLPALLRNLNVATNQFSGPITLTHLPYTIEELSMTYNRISQSVLRYGKWPPGLQFVSLVGCDIPHVKPIKPEYRIRYAQKFFPGLGSDPVVRP